MIDLVPSESRRRYDTSEMAVGEESRRHSEPVLLAWSGGKDSALTLAKLQRSTRWRAVGLLTTVTEEFDRISMHGVRTSLLRAQATAAGLPLTIVRIPSGSDNESYADRMRAALLNARSQGIRSVAFGDLFLQDVRDYREKMLAQVGMKAVFPLWGEATDALAEKFIASGYRAVVTCVDTLQIPGDFAGREYDLEFLRDLPPQADPCGERGEFHSFVHAAPCFTDSIAFTRGGTVLRDDRFMYCDLA